MKKITSFLLAVIMLLSVCSFAVAGEETEVITAQPIYFEGENAMEPVTLNSSADGAPEEQVVWIGNADLTGGVADGQSIGVTLVYKIDGVDSTIVGNYFDAQYNASEGVEGRWLSSDWNYFWNNEWKGKRVREATFEKSGLYYTYLNARIAHPNGNVPFTAFNAITLFKNGKGTNTNENATFQLLAIIPENLSATVSFYSYDGSEQYGTEVSHQYTDGYTTINPGAHQDGNRAFAQAMLLTPNELFELTGATAPTKAEDETFRYELVWRDEPNGKGNIVEGIYKSQALYADFVAIDNTASEVTFVTEGGARIESTTQKKGDAPVYNGPAQEKAADSDATYTFAGWTADGGQTVIADLSTFTLKENSYVFEPVFVADPILKATALVTPDTIPMDGELTVSFKLNRTDLTTDVLAGTKEPITGGVLVFTYNDYAFACEDGAGEITVPFTALNEDGTVDATVTLKARGIVSGEVSFDVTGAVMTETLTDMAAVSIPTTVTVTGQQAGGFFDEDAVTLNCNDPATGKPAEQVVWSGNVPANGANGITFVYEVTGVETPIQATRVNFVANNTLWSKEGDGWFYNNPWNGGAPANDSASVLTINEDGKYFLYFNRKVFHGNNFNSVQELHLFTGKDLTAADGTSYVATNENENATFQMLAVVGGNLKPAVTFCTEDGAEIVTREYAYTDISGTKETIEQGAVIRGTLITPAELFALAQAEAAEGEELAIPEKTSDNPKITYEFDGWVDAEGNPVDGVYMSGKVFAHYRMIDKRTQYKVTFQNHDGTVLEEQIVPEGETPVYTGATPEKPSTDDKSYVFNGTWSPELSAMPKTELNDGALSETTYTFTAQFDEVERLYDVVFKSENGEETYGKDRVNYGKSATAPEGDFSKDADVQYTYTFAGWMDAPGSEGEVVDLTNITEDITVYAYYTATLNQYTVTFMDEDGLTKLGESTVDYGTAATEPETSKESDEWYDYVLAQWVDAEGTPVDITSVTGNIIVYATYAGELKNPYVDLDMSRFYGEAVEYCLVNGIMNGTSHNTFSPDGTTSRAMLVTVLYRLEGSPDISEMGSIPFTDVAAGKYYSEAVVWAYNTGVVNGISDTEYKPDNPVTREQFVTILYRYADEVKGYYMSYGRADLTGFQDRRDISSFAQTAVKWAIATATDLDTAGSVAYNKSVYITGIAGSDGTYMKPKNSTTRAQMATMLYRFITGEKITKTEAGE